MYVVVLPCSCFADHHNCITFPDGRKLFRHIVINVINSSNHVTIISSAGVRGAGCVLQFERSRSPPSVECVTDARAADCARAARPSHCGRCSTCRSQERLPGGVRQAATVSVCGGPAVALLPWKQQWRLWHSSND